MNHTEFLNVMEGILELDEGTLDGTELLNDLEGWDSLAVVGFIAEMDSELDVTLNPNSISNANSVADLTALVADKLSD